MRMRGAGQSFILSNQKSLQRSSSQRRAQAVGRERYTGFGGVAIGGVVAHAARFGVEGEQAAGMQIGAEAEIGAEAVLVAIVADDPDRSLLVDEEGQAALR